MFYEFFRRMRCKFLFTFNEVLNAAAFNGLYLLGTVRVVGLPFSSVSVRKMPNYTCENSYRQVSWIAVN